jgi:hypothetical protein
MRHSCGFSTSTSTSSEEDSDATGRQMTPSTFVQIPIPEEFIQEQRQQQRQQQQAQASQSPTVVTFRYGDLVKYLMSHDRGLDTLPVALFRVGSESTEALQVKHQQQQREADMASSSSSAAVAAAAASASASTSASTSALPHWEDLDVPKHSQVVTNPPASTVCNQYDQLFVLLHSDKVWQKLKSPDKFFQRSDPPAVLPHLLQQSKPSGSGTGNSSGRSNGAAEATLELKTELEEEKGIAVRLQKQIKQLEERLLSCGGCNRNPRTKTI